MSGPDSPPVLATGLRKKYRSRTVLDAIDRSVAAGEVFVLLGPNGAGKHTRGGVLHGTVSGDGGPLVGVRGRSVTRWVPSESIDGADGAWAAAVDPCLRTAAKGHTSRAIIEATRPS